ncbi:DUF5615 family PIN-like protein [Halovivax cerinus]|uniref:DUF5615 family PIN-like protein n=1 Tax=Halovivax cerinus TaxID=1487865 RepID=A0ABD5NUD9_9EURY|nr:DUF5615 family PIN-like protein [Halovivax cerinus]
MEIIADTNVPEEHVSALRGDGHSVVYSRSIESLGPEATDQAIIDYAEANQVVILSGDLTDFGRCEASIPVFVAPHEMTGGDVRAAIARISALAFDPAQTDPIWLSSL